ncbi:MAG: FecR domain-containing protein [Deltaproteobacteria bacterium]|nr:FecR domain-containing protein [Deltaproteobacteria bacterium]MBW1873180.1 FecR domain-containing protein [Deltaproteobacteria bacterium]
MNKTFKSALLVVGIFFLACPVTLAADQIGFVAAAKGDAQVIRGSSSIPARIGVEIVEGDKLQTGTKSRLKVLFTDDALLCLGSNSSVTIKSHLFDLKKNKRHTRVFLNSGKLRALVQKMVGDTRADFEVETSNAVAGVRGTEFVLVAAGADTKLYTLSGSVELQGVDGERVLVAAGQGSRINPEGKADDAVVVAAAELKRVRSETDSRQNPSALAWAAPSRPDDRLIMTGQGVQSGATGDGSQEIENDGEKSGGPFYIPDRKIPEEPVGYRETASASGFGADIVDGDIGDDRLLFGGWLNPDLQTGPNRSAVQLRITLHRN